MSGLPTNTFAMTALSALTLKQMNLDKTESQVVTGLRMAKASSNMGALSAVNDALGESQAMVSTLRSALYTAISVMDAIKNDLVTASEPGADLNEIQTDISARQNLLVSIGSSAIFNGQNWVNTAITALFDAPTGATSGILGAKGAAFVGASILTLNIATPAAAAGDLKNMLTDVETAIGSIATAANRLGAPTTNLTTQQTYVSNPPNSLTTGVGLLVDATMNEAATKLAALQVQQQLDAEALSISSSNTQLILKLFGL